MLRPATLWRCRGRVPLNCSQYVTFRLSDLTAPLGLSQPTVSHHLRILTEAGLLEREQRGVWASTAWCRRRSLRSPSC